MERHVQNICFGYAGYVVWIWIWIMDIGMNEALRGGLIGGVR